MAPGASRRPAAKYKKSVDAIPRSVTATPSERTPSEKAFDSSTPLAPHVAGHEDLGRPGEAGHGPADGPAHGGVQLIGHGAADVVRLEDLIHSCHDQLNLRGRRTLGSILAPVSAPAVAPPAIAHPAPDGHGDEAEHAEMVNTSPTRSAGVDP